MESNVCLQCRLALRNSRASVQKSQTARRHAFTAVTRTSGLARRLSSSAQRRLKVQPPRERVDPAALLSKPTWSVRSLLPSSDAAAASSDVPAVTPQQLRHLLRLAALPPPTSPEEETSMLSTLSSQLHFVRAIQNVNTTGVEPLRAIRDETAEGLQEQTIGLAELRPALEKEDVVGHARRPRRRKDEKVDTQEVENWDVLKGASRTVGRYFVVGSGSGSGKKE